MNNCVPEKLEFLPNTKKIHEARRLHSNAYVLFLQKDFNNDKKIQKKISVYQNESIINANATVTIMITAASYIKS